MILSDGGLLFWVNLYMRPEKVRHYQILKKSF